MVEQIGGEIMAKKKPVSKPKKVLSEKEKNIIRMKVKP